VHIASLLIFYNREKGAFYMSLSKYPPLIDGKIPAFSVVRDRTTPTIITVPYVLNKAVAYEDFTHMVIRIKTVTTGVVKL
jgi:hypothetical protein